VIAELSTSFPELECCSDNLDPKEIAFGYRDPRSKILGAGGNWGRMGNPIHRPNLDPHPLS